MWNCLSCPVPINNWLLCVILILTKCFTYLSLMECNISKSIKWITDKNLLWENDMTLLIRCAHPESNMKQITALFGHLLGICLLMIINQAFGLSLLSDQLLVQTMTVVMFSWFPAFERILSSTISCMSKPILIQFVWEVLTLYVRKLKRLYSCIHICKCLNHAKILFNEKTFTTLTSHCNITIHAILETCNSSIITFKLCRYVFK